MGDIYKTAKGKSLVVTRQDYIKIIIEKLKKKSKKYVKLLFFNLIYR